MTPAGNVSNVGPVSFSSSLSVDELAAGELLGRVLEAGPGLAVERDGRHGHGLRPTGQLAGSEPFHPQPERHRPLADRQPSDRVGELGRTGRCQRDRVRPGRSLDRDVVGVGELGLQRLAERGGAGLGLANLAEVLVERNRLVPPQDREAELAVEAPLVGAFERCGDGDGGERLDRTP